MEEAKIDALNAEVASWAKTLRKKLAMRVGTLTLKDRRALQKSAWNKAKDPDYKKLINSVGASTKKNEFLVNRINIKLVRHGIFMERGAGRFRTLGTGAKPWIVPIMDPALSQLADLLADRYADLIAGEIKFTVPGIISRRIRLGGDVNT
jgi:hypothetical protein